MQFTREELILLELSVNAITDDNQVNVIPEWIENEQGKKLLTEYIFHDIKNKLLDK
jgi:hypothetical protein